MKRLSLIIVFLALASFAAAGQEAFNPSVYKLPSSRRTDVTVRAILPMYFGASTLMNPSDLASGLGNPGFTFAFEMFGLRFSSKGGPLEANAAIGWEFLQHAAYVGAPLRLAVKPGSAWKLFAGATPAVLLGNPVAGSSSYNRFRLSAQAGVAYRTVGLYASYGITPIYTADSTPHTLSLGLVIGI